MTAERQKTVKEPQEKIWWKKFAPPSSYLTGSVKCPEIGNVNIIDENFGDWIFIDDNGTKIGAMRFLNVEQLKEEGDYAPLGTYYIDDFHIEQQFRNKRIGECIYKYLEREFPSDCTEIALRTTPVYGEHNSFKFWRRMGFEIDTKHEGDERTGFRMKKKRLY